jgi:hypothetical protein
MQTLIEIAVALISGGLGVLLFRLLNPRTSVKENQQVIVKVNDIEDKNKELLKQIQDNLNAANKKNDELEKEKNKDVTKEQLEDFFNTRKP